METCWNCKKPIGEAEEASLPMIVKLGVSATMLLVAQNLFYPGHICRQCRVSTGVMGTFGLAIVSAGAAYSIFILVRHL
jgi:hypothetical protein